MVNVRKVVFRLLCLLGTLRCMAAFCAGAEEPDIRRDATVAAVERVMPCIVNIATASVVQYNDFYELLFREFYGRSAPRREQLNSIGSGVIIDEDGYILTNLHVVNRATRTQVKLWNGREYDADRVNANEQTDVALLKVRAQPGEKFKAIKLAADDDILLGETVLALGNPFGLGGSVSKGILSSKSRRPTTGNEPLNINDWLQTDAAINPGNSGGPLINLRGELIGLNVAVFREAQGIGFAIPVKLVSEAIGQFFTPEAENLWFGARLKAGSNPLVVTAVQPDGPAAKAGLREGEHILRVNGQPPGNLIEFNHLLATAPSHKANLEVGTKEKKRAISVGLVPFTELIRLRLGLALSEVNPQANSTGDAEQRRAMAIQEVEKDSPADRAQLKPGYVLTEIEGRPAVDIASVGSALTEKQKGESVRLAVMIQRRLGSGFVEFRQGTVEVPVR